jgi:SAM-dependent methyltransferase
VGRWSRRVAPPFLDWLALPGGLRWLDVGCGTGALCAAIADRCAPGQVTGVEPSGGFLATARESLGGHATFLQGSATSIPLPGRSVDVVVSGLVLNFVPEKEAALAEMRRVAAPGGTIAAYVWDYAGRMELMRHFWDAVVSLDPSRASLDEGRRFPVCRPEALEALFRAAGLAEAAVREIDVATPFASFDDYWEPFLGGQGPAPAYAMSLDEAARGKLREDLRARLPTKPDGTIDLVARAWAVRSVSPG